jgi:hypothetical protein
MRARRQAMATHVNLDALIPREDFAVITDGREAPVKHSIQISELEQDQFFYRALRKPDFQRETGEWDSKRVVGLISSFIEEDLIPAIILWRHKDLLFVIDGSHRLSALIAWVQDDYGDGDRSQKFFNYTIPEEQLAIARKTKAIVEKEFGSYKSHKEAITNPDAYGPDIIRRALRFGSISMELQWVKGDSATAEESFVRINQQAAIITPQELELIRTRKKPNTIAARAIIRRGTGHKYWYPFAENERKKIEELGTEIHNLIFNPVLKTPIKSLELPAGGSVYSSPSLRMVYDFINLCVGVPSPSDDTKGDRTVEYLSRCHRVMQLILSNHPSSLGLHPAVYFYSWTGKQQPVLFLAISNMIIDMDRSKKLPIFIECRKAFEDFLIEHRSLLNQLVRKFGTKDSGGTHLVGFYRLLLKMITEKKSEDDILASFTNNPEYSYLQPAESPYDIERAKGFSSKVKSGLIIKELLGSAPRCQICQGMVPTQAISIDHIKRTVDGGQHSLENAQLTHPYCNTGYKEHLISKDKGRMH